MSAIIHTYDGGEKNFINVRRLKYKLTVAGQPKKKLQASQIKVGKYTFYHLCLCKHSKIGAPSNVHTSYYGVKNS